ncbi:hypothetical protein I4U23_011765 [Adineta vaga]|nr:hypothetical protein I4U23_011765 [Adineta vaga]
MDSRTKFILMIILEIPAIFISIRIFIHFLITRQARLALRNHGWIVLILTNFIQLVIDLPISMSYYYRETVWPTSDLFCALWDTCEFSLNSIGLFLMAWISIERHLIVFHSQRIFQRRWKRWLFHFIPILFCLLWSPIFFFILIVISPLCTNQWDYNFLSCGAPCYYGVMIVGQFDFCFNIVIPNVIIMLANVTLIIRVIYQKLSRQQVIHWRRHRKMVLQLWIISSLYMAFWLPVSITILIQITIDPSFMIDSLSTMQFFTYLIPLLLPMICLSTLSDLTKKILRRIINSRINIVGAVVYTRNVKPTVAAVTVR